MRNSFRKEYSRELKKEVVNLYCNGKTYSLILYELQKAGISIKNKEEVHDILRQAMDDHTICGPNVVKRIEEIKKIHMKPYIESYESKKDQEFLLKKRRERIAELEHQLYSFDDYYIPDDCPSKEEIENELFRLQQM